MCEVFYAYQDKINLEKPLLKQSLFAENNKLIIILTAIALISLSFLFVLMLKNINVDKLKNEIAKNDIFTTTPQNEDVNAHKDDNNTLLSSKKLPWHSESEIDSVLLDENSARIHVGDFLNNYKNGNNNQARSMVTNNFLNKFAVFFDYDVSGFFILFEIQSVEIIDDSCWVYVKETWNSGPDNSAYKVIIDQGQLKIDDQTWI